MRNEAQTQKSNGKTVDESSHRAKSARKQRKELHELLRKRYRTLVTMVSRVNTDDDPEAVHKSRVSSRRFQQALTPLFEKPRPKGIKKLWRTPRQVRRWLGDWRNDDILIQQTLKEEHRARTDEKRKAWRIVRAYLVRRKAQHAALARRKLAKCDLADLAYRMEKVFGQNPAPDKGELSQRIHEGVEVAWERWQGALEQARKSREMPDIHAFRVATKRLRYRLELAKDLGQGPGKETLSWLESLQDALGEWHDQAVLRGLVTDLLASPEFHSGRLAAARSLLSDIEQGRKAQMRALEKIFHMARPPFKSSPGSPSGAMKP